MEELEHMVVVVSLVNALQKLIEAEAIWLDMLRRM